MILLRGKNSVHSFTGEQIFIDYTRAFLSNNATDLDTAISMWNNEGFSVEDDGREMNDFGEETD